MEQLRIYLAAQRGRVTELAVALKLYPSAISQWDRIPAERVVEVERITGISRHELRPDIFGPAPASMDRSPQSSTSGEAA